MKRAVIFGVSGQDGSYLARHLLTLGYEVHGTSRRSLPEAGVNLARLGIDDRIRLHRSDLLQKSQICDLLSAINPEEIYLLAGQSSVAKSFSGSNETFSGVIDTASNVLDAHRSSAAKSRLFHASSSDCFGSLTVPARIDTPFNPLSPYAAAKAQAHEMVAKQRSEHGLYAVSALLFNHESPLRPDTFVSRKIVLSAARIFRGAKEKLVLGNLDVERDWGWAPEYVEAMHLMLQQSTPKDFIVASGYSWALRDFVASIFTAVGLDWRDHVQSSPEFFRPNDILKAGAHMEHTRRNLGWHARTYGPALAGKLIECELSGSWG